MKLTKTISLLSLVAMTALSSIAAAPTKDIVDTAVSAGKFKTLASLLTKAGLVEVLKSDGPFTVFAPTDAAFNKVPKSVLDALGSNKEALKKVLTYHVVAGNVMAADVVKLNSAKTVEGESVKIKVKHGKVFLNGKTQVITTDVSTTNGTIHIIDNVLIPPSVQKMLAQKSHH
ncbi:MAG: fasciclin domain-containing protein [Armatimonadetes bacterium]|nr:fasciclin domain-containing protein [Armatimonadota bacterium]